MPNPTHMCHDMLWLDHHVVTRLDYGTFWQSHGMTLDNLLNVGLRQCSRCSQIATTKVARSHGAGA